MIKSKKVFSLILVILFSTVNIFSLYAETPEPYEEDEFPQTLQDLRRFEIITLGAMPFVTLDATIGYAAYQSAVNNTPFNPFSTANYSKDETLGIIFSSLAISVGIGLTDYIINLIKRSSKNKKLKADNNSYINIIPISEDPEAIKIDLSDSKKQNISDIEEEKDDFEEIIVEVNN